MKVALKSFDSPLTMDEVMMKLSYFGTSPWCRLGRDLQTLAILAATLVESPPARSDIVTAGA